MRSLTFYAKTITNWMPDWMFKAVVRRYIDYRRPRHIFIETTKRCNFTCSYCPRPRSNEDMDFELFTKIVSQLTARTSFSLHVFGEPLLYPRFREALQLLTSKRHSINVTTNGFFLNEFADDLVRAKANVIFSWHQDSEKRITEITRSRLAKINFKVRSLNEKVPERWMPWLEIRDFHNYGGMIDLSQSGANVITQRWPCYHLWLAPAVSVKGKMLACCADPQERLILGDLSTESITSIWNSNALNQIRQEHLAGIYRSPCDKCDVWKTVRAFF